jgi:hypothetical protein
MTAAAGARREARRERVIGVRDDRDPDMPVVFSKRSAGRAIAVQGDGGEFEKVEVRAASGIRTLDPRFTNSIQSDFAGVRFRPNPFA